MIPSRTTQPKDHINKGTDRKNPHVMVAHFPGINWQYSRERALSQYDQVQAPLRQEAWANRNGQTVFSLMPRQCCFAAAPGFYLSTRYLRGHVPGCDYSLWGALAFYPAEQPLSVSH